MYVPYNMIIFLIDYKRDEDKPMDIEMNSMGTANNPQKHSLSVNSFIRPGDKS